MSRIYKTTLKNGLKIITEEMPDIQSATIGIWVNIGSRDEDPIQNGISHFIEHLLFKGTKKRSALDISREIESVGGVLNAFTGRESTCFYVKVLSHDIPLAVDILSDIFLNSTFDKKEMEKERQVVLQEIKMVDDTPDDLIHDLFAKAFWKGQSIGMSILGDSKTVNSITRDDVWTYYKKSYLPHAVIITAAGNIEHKKLLKLLKPFGSMPHSSGSRDMARPDSVPGIYIEQRAVEQVHVCLGTNAPGQSHPDRYAIYLLNTILGGGMSSRLFQEIREKRGLAYSVYSYLNLYIEAGSLVIYAGVNHDAFDKALKLIMKELEKFVTTEVSGKELQSAKEQLKGSMLLGLETSESRMTKLARDEIYFNRAVSVDEIVKGIDRVAAKDIKRLARDSFDPDKITLAALGRVNDKQIPKALRGKR